ncbi:MAG: M36 family metallopeptidase [Saprospiraceae bacterium]|nr:MAG: metalloprotease [Bacteroidetes bacterium OLB9]MCO6462916.1 M36 family metallopeptidase [Saprospiraceae bacterium]
MKQLILFLLVVFQFSLVAQAPVELQTAINHIHTKAEVWQLKSADYADLMISSEVINAQGVSYLYLNQAYQGIPIRNAMAVIVLKDGKVVSDANNFVQNIESKIKTKSEKISASQAIINAADHLGVAIKGSPIMSRRNNTGKLEFELPELASSAITAQLKYELVGDQLVLVWNLQLDMKKNADYWDFNVDANTGQFVSKYNYTVYCNHQHGQYNRHDDCGIATIRSNDDHAQPVGNLLMGSDTPMYNVYELPVESPIHGQRTIVSDDQYTVSSPFGWHDVNGQPGPEYTITRGNNVYAFQDKDNNDRPDGIETDGGEELIFDFPVDLNKDPRVSEHAAVTNLFYMNNMMHDISNLLGFTEEFGNFQAKNYTGVDGQGDHVLAQAFDGINLFEAGGNDNINNANFSTPTDGFNGRMQMYLWTNRGGTVAIDAPETLKGFINEYGEGQFGAPIPNENEPAISGSVALARTSAGTTGCTSLTNKEEMNGKVALIDRGTCDFSHKVYNAQQAGAIAAIICNIPGINGGNGEEIVGMAAGLNAEKVTIPSIFVKKSDCDRIRVEINNGKEVVITFKKQDSTGPEYFDGSLDNGVIAHEYGHGISTRLTGGRLQSGCLNNDEQMGEGWSDYFALILTQKEGDLGSTPRGIGTFVSGQGTDGGGIRRYPYSTDMNFNPQTYKDIRNTSSPHAVGEVWADILWDMHWRFIDLYGFDPDWHNTKSGNFIAAFLVVEGLKLQPCEPNFITGRNAIMKADSIYFDGAHGRLLWETFARRGVGYYASAGKTRNDNVEDFNVLPTLITKLKITKTADGLVDPGNEITVHLKGVNHIPARQNDVIITDDMPDGLSYVAGSADIEPVINGNQLIFNLGDMEYKDEFDITYKLKSDKTIKSTRLEYEGFDNNYDWDIENIKGSEDWFTSFDLYKSPEVSFTIFNSDTEGDASLFSIPYEIRGTFPVMRFWHRHNTQTGVDGGLVEISVDGGPYQIVGKEKFIRNGYNYPLDYSTLADPNIWAFSGKTEGDWKETLEGSWIDSYVDLTEYIGHEVAFKFRFVCNEDTKPAEVINGWFIDDFEVLDMIKYSTQACISADNGAGERACTDVVETIVNTDQLTSSKDSHINSYFKVGVTPNPAGDYVAVSVAAPSSVKAELSLLNTDGRAVYHSTIDVKGDVTVKTIDTSSFPAGFYLIRVVNGKHVTTEKLIIK